MTTIYKLDKLKKMYNKTIIKLLKKDFIQKLKIIKNASNDIIFCKVKNNLKRYSTTFNDNKTGDEDNNNSDIKKVKTNIKRYSTNNFEIKDIKEDDIVSYNMKNNLKRYSTTLFKKDDNKTDKEKDIPSIKIVKTNKEFIFTGNDSFVINFTGKGISAIAGTFKIFDSGKTFTFSLPDGNKFFSGSINGSYEYPADKKMNLTLNASIKGYTGSMDFYMSQN